MGTALYLEREINRGSGPALGEFTIKVRQDSKSKLSREESETRVRCVFLVCKYPECCVPLQWSSCVLRG